VSKSLIRNRRVELARFTSPSIRHLELTRLLSANAVLDPVVTGRRVAVVGPAQVGTSAEEIHAFDTVARIGCTGPSSVPASSGKRCDISIYAPHHANDLARRILEGGNKPSVRAALLRSGINITVERIISEQIPTQRISNSFLKNELHCKPNILPQLIFWILSRQPSELHITHADLFVSKKYPIGYAANKERLLSDGHATHLHENMWRSFSRHNPFIHHALFKWLGQHANVSFSPQLGEVVAMTSRAYGLELYRMYSI
jgi:hypothetical protein